MTFSRLSHVAEVSVSTVDKHTVEGEVPVRLCNYVDVYKNDAIVDGLNFMSATATPEEIRRFSIAPGDTLFTKDSETADDIGVPAYVKTSSPLVCGYHVAIARPRERAIHPRYLYWSLASSAAAQQWQVLATGVTRVGLRQSDIGKLSIWMPDLQEQAVIADFLDRETAKIDALIAKQHDLVTALRDRRESAVMDAVTGHERTGPKRDSDVRWIGEVPEHWQVGNIRRYASMHSGHTPSRQVPEYWEDCTVPWFTLADVWQLRDDTQIYLGETAERISELGLHNSSAELLPTGTVALSRTASVGFSGIMPEPMATSQDFWNWVCGPDLLPEFLLRVFRAMRREMRSLMAGSTHQTIYKTDAASFVIPVPPLDEQQTIVDHLDEELRRMDGLVDRATALVEVLQERRAALITAAVTGKLDVTTYGKAD